MLAAQAGVELRLALRHGESVLLTLIIPIGLLVFFSTVDVLPAGSGRAVDFLVPGVLALAVMSTAFTGQAIATGFERSYGVLKRLGASPLPRSVLLAGKTLAVAAVEGIGVVMLVTVGFALGWEPQAGLSGALWAAVLLLLATVAFSGLGLLMAGTLPAEATLAAANAVYLVFLLLGGVVFPVTELPGWLQGFAGALPTGALSGSLRSVLADGAAPSGADVAVLAAWAVGASALAARLFRWE
jgi:ABC-2 type transport system permease protein